MAIKIGSLFATLRLDGKGFKREISRARKQIKGLARTAARAGAKLGAFLGIGSIAGFAILTKRTVALGDEIAKTAKKLGISTKALQEWRFVASQSGVAQATLDKSLAIFTKGVGDAAKGTGLLRDDLVAMGISFRDASGKVRDTSDLLPEFLDKLGRVDSQTQKTTIAMDAFGARGLAMVNVANTGAAAFNKLRQKAHELGIVLGGDLLRDAEELNDQFDILGRVVSTTVTRAILDLAPQITNLTNKLINNRQVIKDAVTDFFNIGTAMFRAAAGAASFFTQLGKGLGIKAAQFINPNIEDRLISLREKIDQLKKAIASPVGQRARSPVIKQLRETQKEYDALIKKQEKFQKLMASFKPAKIDTGFQAPELIDRPLLKLIPKLDKVKKKIKEVKDETAELNMTFSSAFEDAIVSGEKFSTVLKGLAQDLFRIFLRKTITEPAGAVIGSFFGGFFADGGRPPVGKASIVGDGGEPELFIPDTAGTILPFSKLGGGITNNITINAPNAAPGMEIRIRQAVDEAVAIGQDLIMNDFNRAGPLYRAAQ